MEKRSGSIAKARSKTKTVKPKKPFNAVPSARSIGAAAGGGKGAAIGAVIGAGGGAGAVIVEGRDQLDLPRGTELTTISSTPTAQGERTGAQR